MPPPSEDDDATRVRPVAAPEPVRATPALPVTLGPQETALPVGTRIEEFEITGLIGQGGFGVVYIADDKQLGREVALKEFMPVDLVARAPDGSITVQSEEFRETFDKALHSFVNEARTLAKFDHPSLVRVHRYFESNGTAYMAMPRLGETLSKKIKRDGSPDEEWLKHFLLAPLLDALDHLHGRDTLHRDIKPGNIVLEPDRPVLLDFGSARQIVGDRKQTLTVMYSPGYTPIEQLGEDSVNRFKQGPWTDLYSVGAVLYYAVTKRAPIASEMRFISDSLEPAVKVGAGRYSQRFLEAIDAAMRVRPEQRPQSVAAFRALVGLEEPATRTRPAPTRMRPPAREHAEPDTESKAPSKGVLIGGGVAAALVIAAAAAWWLWPSGEPLPVAPPPPAPVAEAVPAPAPVPEPPPPKAPVLAQPRDVLDAIFTQRDPGHAVSVSIEKPKVRIQKDQLHFTVNSAQPGYVYVLLAGTQNELLLVFPNDVDRNHRIEAGKPMPLPRTGWEMEAAGPPGIDQFLVVVAGEPRDLAGAGGTKVGPYLEFPAAAWTALPAWIGGGPACAPGSPGCAYGASAFSIEEVP